MSSFIFNNVLEIAFGVLWDQTLSVCGLSIKKLKEGDLTDEKCRQLIARELDDIKSSLDGLSRKDLLSSVSSLKEGVSLLNNISLANSTEDVDKKVSSTDGAAPKGEAHQLQATQAGGSSVMELNGSRISRLNALHNSITRLDTASKNRLASAVACFKIAREKATDAFSNKALSTEDSILATKLKVISRMLESVADPSMTIDACKCYVKELHDMPAVKKIFSVHFSGGIKSYVMRKKRLEHIVSVINISVALLKFMQDFCSGEVDTQGQDWPKIELRCGEFNPICGNTVEEVMRRGFVGPMPFVGQRSLIGLLGNPRSSDYV